MEAPRLQDLWEQGGMLAVSALLLVAAIAALALWWRERQLRLSAESDAATNRHLMQSATAQMERLQTQLEAKEEAFLQAGRAQVAAETRMEGLEQQLIKAFEEKNQALTQKEMAFTQKQAADQRVALMQQEIKSMQARMQDWEGLREQSLNAAKASVLEAGQQLSSKLLEDHKRELAESQKQTEQATATLHQQFQTVLTSVGHLKEQLGEQQQTVATVWKALTVPNESGRFAEIGLENTLKAFGLQAKRDYVLQHSLDGESGKLRPDALVFLPHDTVMVIDSKASSFVLEYANADDNHKAEAANNLVQAMNRHMKSLISKDYEKAVRQTYQQAEVHGREVKRVINLMYLPHEAALEHLHEADADFAMRAAQHNLVISGPTGLAGLMALCKLEIAMAAQHENHEHIIHAVSDLLESTAVALGKAQSVGKGLKQAADSFSDFSKSVNSRVLPRARKLMKFGVTPSKQKHLPTSLPSFSILEESHLIDMEAEEAPSGEGVQERGKMKLMPYLADDDAA